MTETTQAVTTPTSAEDSMRRLRRGFAKADRSELEAAVTDDFEWHMHWQESPDDEPTGKVLRSLDEVMVEIERRRDQWSDLSYDRVEERYTDDMIVQTFVVSGIDADGRRFSSEAVDLYPLRDGRITRKQTYWKQFS